MMELENDGSKVLDVVSSAKRHVILVSPRIDHAVLESVMDAIQDTVQEIDCITGWTRDDADNRLCELRVFDLLASRRGARLWNRQHLHAKYIRGDDRCLVGSGNLTASALGWESPSFYELKIEVPSSFPGVLKWETALFAGSHLVTSMPGDELAEETGEPAIPRPPRPSTEAGQNENQDRCWFPRCPCPEKLYGVYTGSIGISEMAGAAYELARRDLRALNPPAGRLSEENFARAIASRLTAMNVVRSIVPMTRSGLSDWHAMEIVASMMGKSHEIEPEDAWKTLKLWMLHFFPNEFRIEPHQEVLVNGPMPPS